MHRVFNYKQKVWKAEVLEGTFGEPDAILLLTDHAGNQEEVFGEQVKIDYSHEQRQKNKHH